jgi:hypothetical protein
MLFKDTNFLARFTYTTETALIGIAHIHYFVFVYKFQSPCFKKNAYRDSCKSARVEGIEQRERQATDAIYWRRRFGTEEMLLTTFKNVIENRKHVQISTLKPKSESKLSPTMTTWR